MMLRSSAAHGRCFRFQHALTATLAAAMLAAGAPMVRGQAPVDTRLDLRLDRGVSMGRGFDANPMLGGGGFNYARPASPLVGGNFYASGLVGRGLSLRSYSPISDPTAFQGPLGSTSLSSFQRDSVSVLSAPLGSGSFGQPYYDSARTAPSAGFLQGLAGFSSVTASPTDTRLAPRIAPPSGLTAAIVGMRPPAAAPAAQTPPSALATSSSIFGPEILPRILLPTQPEQPSWERGTAETDVERGLAARFFSPAETSPGFGSPAITDALATPLSGLLRADLYPQLGVRTPADAETLAPVAPSLIIPAAETPVAAATPVTPVTAPPVDPRVLPGYEVFTDLQLAAALLSDPNPTWFDEMRRALRERPELAQQASQQIAADAAQFLDDMLRTPLRSLTGGGESALNEQMLKAEALMQIGHYSEAADRYDAARLADPTNPLPLIGKAHALLAQGSYSSAATTLVQGVELADRIPGLAGLLFSRLDLTALLGGGEIIDIRRADIMRQLERREDVRLRFLLGYLEYHSGDQQHGLENLARAARDPKADAVIGRYPTLVQPQSGARPRSAAPTEGPPARATEELIVPPRPE
ncbi:MAG TPA: tetratricopeptide repeat protein [Phycisphaerae bacterium]|nr:tetratricopeptide repeat protein [Phycisphaerae bacterium]